MNIPSRWRRSATAFAVAAIAAPVAIAAAPAGAGAAPVRTAITTNYTDTTYLQDAGVIPTSDNAPSIEPVTYDRFQWLLQQSGNFAFLIGDPAEDPNFKARAQDVEAAAEAAGAKKVYWFDPNLSGSAKVGTTTEPNLDIRNPAGITSLSAASQTVYGNVWLNIVGQYLGDGVTATPASVGTESATVTASTGTATVNDYGLNAGYSTEVGNDNGGALYDYSSGSAPTDVSDSYFFIYNKDHTVAVSGTPEPQKVVSWVDLDNEPSSLQTQADVTTAINTVGSSNLDDDQFAWWESEVNSKEHTQASTNADGGNVPVLTDADNSAADGGWRVDQITYPELVDLLKSDTSANAVILFGGTWCPNTRPVLPFINQQAQDNNVEVFNFDTVLDGGTVGGGTTSSSNPLQSRNSAAYGATPNANPTFLYGDLVKKYLDNIETQYNPTVGDGSVTYFPGGSTSSALATVNKLQVPFLIGYQGGASLNPDAGSGGGVARQWIEQNADASGLPYFTEYMSDWWFTNPQPNELGISTIPLDAPIWSTLNSELADFTWQTDPTTLYPSTASDTDDAQYLDSADTAKVTYTAAPASVTVASSGPVSISPAALSAALSDLGSSAPVNLAAAKTALIGAETAGSTQAISDLTTVVGAWGVAQQRKSKVITAWGSAQNPGSIAGGAAAVHALSVFFGGLPGPVVSTQTVSAPSVDSNTAATITVSVSNDYERVPTGNVSLVVKASNGTTVSTQSVAVADGQASFTLPVLPADTYSYSLSYAGDDQILAFTDTGSLTVTPVTPPANTNTTPTPTTTVTQTTTVTTTTTTPVTTTPPAKAAAVARIKVKHVAGIVTLKPTTSKDGTYKVTITPPTGKAKPTGKVTVKLKKGKTTKAISGRLAGDSVTLLVPKLAAGTWKVAIGWNGDANYLSASATGASIKVKAPEVKTANHKSTKKATTKKK